MNKKNKAFILMNLFIVTFMIFPQESFSQENNCLNDFKNWILKNKDNSEKIVYTLPCDMVIDDYFEFFTSNTSNITIDTNEHKILVKDKGTFYINGSKLNIIGEGGKEGIIHVENGGKLDIGIENIIALDGTALYVEKDTDVTIRAYYGEIGNIKASGKNAIGIYSENDIKIDAKSIEVDGENSIGIYCKREVEIEDTSIVVNAGNKRQNGMEKNETEKSIVSENKTVYVIGDKNKIVPEIPEEDYSIIRCYRRGIGVFEEEIMLTKEDKIEDIVLPRNITIKTSSGTFTSLDVEWDLSNYYTDLNDNTDFVINGEFKPELVNEKNIVLNDDVIPILNVHVTDKEPINDLNGYFFNSKIGYSVMLEYSMPYNSKKMFVEYSDDGINWVSEEMDYISNQVTLNFEDFKLRCFRIRVEGGVREGYSNIFLKPGFVMGGGSDQMTPDDDRDVVVDGGDRGGGGRDDPDRDEDKNNQDGNNGNENNDSNNNQNNNDENNNSDEKQPNAPKDDVESSTDSTTNKNPQDDIPKNDNKENDSDKEKGFDNKSSVTENNANYDLYSKSVFGTNEHSSPYRENILNKNQDTNKNKSNVSDYNGIINNNYKLESKEYNLKKDIIFFVCILTLIMIGSILIVNSDTRKSIVKFIKVKK